MDIMIKLKKMGKKFKKVLKLDTFPLVLYESEIVPEDAVPICSVDGCVAKSIFLASIGENASPLYTNKKSLKGCCPGSITYLGFGKPPKFMKYFVSTGKETIRGGDAEYLKASPEDVEKYLESIGNIKPIENNLVIKKCEDMGNNMEDINLKSILIFGDAEQLRNLSCLTYFKNENTFGGVSMPFGPSCTNFITYPNSMAEKAPKNTSFLGPADPTGNNWFPSDYLSMGIPLKVAIELYEKIDDSFLSKRPQIAFPEK